MIGSLQLGICVTRIYGPICTDMTKVFSCLHLLYILLSLLHPFLYDQLLSSIRSLGCFCINGCNYLVGANCQKKQPMGLQQHLGLGHRNGQAFSAGESLNAAPISEKPQSAELMLNLQYLQPSTATYTSPSWELFLLVSLHACSSLQGSEWRERKV